MVNGTLEQLTNSTSLYDLGEFITTASNNMFWFILLIGIYIILIVKLHQYGIERAIAVASFSTLMLSFPLFYLGWINVIFPIILTILLAGSLAYIRLAESN